MGLHYEDTDCILCIGHDANGVDIIDYVSTTLAYTYLNAHLGLSVVDSYEDIILYFDGTDYPSASEDTTIIYRTDFPVVEFTSARRLIIGGSADVIDETIAYNDINICFGSEWEFDRIHAHAIMHSNVKIQAILPGIQNNGIEVNVIDETDKAVTPLHVIDIAISQNDRVEIYLDTTMGVCNGTVIWLMQTGRHYRVVSKTDTILSCIPYDI